MNGAGKIWDTVERIPTVVRTTSTSSLDFKKKRNKWDGENLGHGGTCPYRGKDDFHVVPDFKKKRNEWDGENLGHGGTCPSLGHDDFHVVPGFKKKRNEWDGENLGHGGTCPSLGHD